MCSNSNELNPDHLNDQTVFIQYEELCVKIDAIQLISLLGQNENKLQTDQPLNNTIFYEIWYFKRNFNDFVYCGSIYESIYDNLIQQSLFNQDNQFRIKDQRTIKRDLLVTVGNESFLNFYDLNKTQQEVTIKGAVTSLVSSFIFGSSSHDQPKFISNNASLFFNINKQSTGNSIVLSPNRSLALVYDQRKDQTDDNQIHSTVSLINLRRKEVIRIWKGDYKNCQFSFIEINNSLNSGSEKALFVCFYVPESNSIEIWPSRFDDKIVSLEIGSNCVMISNPILFKAKNLPIVLNNKTSFNIPSTILFDFDTFTCYTFDISFLCAVTDYKINSRDDLLLKEIPRTINNSQFKKEDLEPILKKLTSPENKLTVLKIIFEKNDLDLVDYTIMKIKANLKFIENDDKLCCTEEEQTLLNNFKFITDLGELFVYMNKKNETIANFVIKKNILKETPDNITEETEYLRWKEKDFVRIIPLFIFSEHLDPDDLNFQLPSLTVQEFFNFFKFDLNTSKIKSQKCHIKLEQENLHKLSTFLFSYLILEDQDLKIIDFYLQHSISALDLIYLLFHAWSVNKFTYNWKTWKFLLLIAYYLVEEYQKEIDYDEKLFKRNLINCLKQACRLFLASTFIQSAIVGTYTIQVIYNIFCKKDKQMTDYFEAEYDEWVEISLDEESFSSVLKQLEDLYLLNLLLQCGKSNPDQQMSLIKLVKSKNSLTAELVALHCVRNFVDPNVISKSDSTDEEESSDDSQVKIESNFKTEIDKALKMFDEADEDLFSQLFRHVQLRFPCNLNTSVLLSHCAWQSILEFINNPSITNEAHLKQCLNYLDRIKDPVLKHKMALLIWKAFITEKFAKINRIIFDEKWNCSNLNELGIEEITLEPFIMFISDFTEFIFNTINDALNSVQINYKRDDWWMPKKNKLLIENQQKSIVEVALSLRIAKHNIVLLHSQLALLSNLTINFKENMITSLKTCFPQTVTSLLYNDLHIDLKFDDDNEHLKKCREIILKKFTCAIARNVSIVTTKIPNDQERKSFSEANSWISKLIDLAQDWNIDTKLVRTNYVFVLYSIGCDALAREGKFSFYLKNEQKLDHNQPNQIKN